MLNPLKMGLNVTYKTFMLSDLLYKAAGQTVNMSAGLPASDKGIVPGIVHLSKNTPEYKARFRKIVIRKAFDSSGEKAFLSDKLFGPFCIKRGEDVLFCSYSRIKFHRCHPPEYSAPGLVHRSRFQ